MSLQLSGVKGRGAIESERVVLRVASQAEIGSYFLLQTGCRDNQPTNTVYRTFWIPDTTVSSGDLVVIYSKAGENKAKKNKDGSMTHFFYRGQPKPIWDQDDRAALVVEAYSWSSLTPEAF